jgi:hypothetical protein
MRPALAPGDFGFTIVRGCARICGCSPANLCVSFSEEEEAGVGDVMDPHRLVHARTDAEASGAVSRRFAALDLLLLLPLPCTLGQANSRPMEWQREDRRVRGAKMRG